jgi:hypothetical protein
VQGSATPTALATRVDGRALGGRMWVEYLHREASSWASQIPSIARRVGLGRADPGTWVVWVALALMVGVAALASRAVLTGLR